MSRPSVFFDNVDELRNEYDWMYEFMSRMAESIRGNPDVHNLHDYVAKIECENVKLRELVRVILSDMDAWQMVIASGDTGYGKGCLERLYDLRDQAHELGVEVGE